jgi:hypothetical protein
MQENNSGIGEKEKIVEIEIERLREFRGHPFKVRQDEQMDMLMESIKEYGYKRADFVLACVNTASKGSMEKAHKKIVKSHKAILLEKQALAKKQAAEAAKAEHAI